MGTSLQSKVIVVTGSSRGIGRHLAMLLLERGATVVLNGRDPERLEKTRVELAERASERVSALAGDVSHLEFCKSLAEFVRTKHGRLDGLINNAGASMRGNFSELSAATVDSIVHSNLQGSIYPTLACGPLLKESRGSVVFVSSLAGARGFPGVSVYSAAKMALTGLSQSLRAEWSSAGVHVGLVFLAFTENDPDKRHSILSQ